ncbi:MAG: hypothetical protein ABEJ96_04535 [Thiohalorhabdaceae bacterium]
MQAPTERYHGAVHRHAFWLVDDRDSAVDRVREAAKAALRAHPALDPLVDLGQRHHDPDQNCEGGTANRSSTCASAPPMAPWPGCWKTPAAPGAAARAGMPWRGGTVTITNVARLEVVAIAD